MLVYLLDREPEKCEAFTYFFKDEKDVIVEQKEFEKFIKDTYVECVVSPANSYGLMDGGYDAAITRWYGDDLQKRVQQYIIDNFYGEQPLGTSFIIPINKNNQYLINTPTMRIPEQIKDAKIIYHCMRSTLITASKNNIQSIVIPMFGGLTGRVSPNVAARYMYLAYNQIKNPPNHISWDYALDKII